MHYIFTEPWKEMSIQDQHLHIRLWMRNNKRTLDFVRTCRETISFDTETYKGKCKLIADSNKRYLLNPTFDSVIEFLFYKASESGIYRFFFNIDFDISAILKLWRNIDKIRLLKDGEKVKYKDYEFFWLKGIMFKITKGHKSVVFTDLYKFFLESLQKSIQKYVGSEGKDPIDGEQLNTSLLYWNRNLNDIIEYCIKDCVLTNQLAQMLVKALEKAEVAFPKLLCSSGSLAKSDFRTNCIIPNLENVPKPIVQIAYWTYFGGKFEVFKRGYFPKLYLYDINSQYPAITQYLPNLNYGAWIRTTEINNEPIIGYYLVDLDIPEYWYCSPVQYKMKNGLILSVVGEIKNKWLTWYDVDLVRQFVKKIHFGVEFYPKLSFENCPIEKRKYVYPFHERINFHYGYKNSYKETNKMMYQIHKLTMNAFIGCNMERHIKSGQRSTVGKLFNPIYSSTVLSFGRWSVVKELNEQERKDIVAIHTDSIITQSPKQISCSDKLGEWNKEVEGDGLILTTGMYQIGHIVKSRGVPLALIGNWKDFCSKYSEAQEVEMEFKHMRKISECLARDKNIEFVNTFQDKKRTIRANADQKRNWNSEFETFGDLLSRNIDSLHYYVKMSKNQHSVKADDLCINPLYF